MQNPIELHPVKGANHHASLTQGEVLVEGFMRAVEQGIRGDVRDVAALACLAPSFPGHRTPAYPIAAGVDSPLPWQRVRGVVVALHGAQVTYQRKRH